mmetsp:Transcript_66133/g.158200  ORF Transcript_66133/g.158200 Transcript_66133/m.158200 type:complete len:115 (+) Transcript_66133:72-416(+)|eukprot:CAMPEP_0178451922 /NCGR_PEP_ID=MMETSP0689_2-20121128/43954_1 /TAXON_ID=160604 /ORGANISM="Amphidinium massartii, Strain CS-259" /LENGTH=114 /DNA_ID=CAMNT_0020077563 /DNA_START=56 /DNA_END=400 /DNA_ORIENTATION=-
MAEGGDGSVGAFPSQYDESGLSSFDKVEQDLRGALLTLSCSLPDGSIKEISCNCGHDVAYAKGLLARALDVEYGRIKFFFDGKLMFDPLSFNDFPAITANPAQKVPVSVTVDPE